MTKLTDAKKKKLFSELGKIGGNANFKKHGVEQMKRISKLAVKAKRVKKKNENK